MSCLTGRVVVFNEKLARLRAQLLTEFDEADRLGKVIRERLEGLVRE